MVVKYYRQKLGSMDVGRGLRGFNLTGWSERSYWKDHTSVKTWKGASHVNIWSTNIWGRKKSKWKGLEVGTCLKCLRISELVSMVGTAPRGTTGPTDHCKECGFHSVNQEGVTASDPIWLMLEQTGHGHYGKRLEGGRMEARADAGLPWSTTHAWHLWAN